MRGCNNAQLQSCVQVRVSCCGKRQTVGFMSFSGMQVEGFRAEGLGFRAEGFRGLGFMGLGVRV